MYHHNGKAYTTHVEKLFLDELGPQMAESCSATRIKLLTGYIKGAEKRDKWELMSGRAVIAHAKKLLKEEKDKK